MPLPFLGIGAAALRIGAGRAALGRLAGAAISELLEDDVQSLDVSSSFIRRITWHPGDTLVVQMKNGKEWSYICSKDTFEEFAKAPSKGQFFNERIK